MTAIRLNIGGVELTGTLDNSPLAQQVVQLLPIDTVGETWGREIYFPVKLVAANSAPTTDVKVGDIAYWPDGPDLCVFLGPTPKSQSDAPVVASPVTVIGSCQFQPGDFERIERRSDGVAVRVEPAH